MTGECRLCGHIGLIETHHVFMGSYRRLSDKYGATVTLCPYCHRYIHSAKGVEARRQLQHDVQQAYMDKMGWNVNQWISIWGKSWL